MDLPTSSDSSPELCPAASGKNFPRSESLSSLSLPELGLEARVTTAELAILQFTPGGGVGCNFLRDHERGPERPRATWVLQEAHSPPGLAVILAVVVSPGWCLAAGFSEGALHSLRKATAPLVWSPRGPSLVVLRQAPARRRARDR